VQAGVALAAAGGRRELLDREGGGRAGEDRVLAQVRLELLDQRDLVVELLDDRLDEVAGVLAEPGEVRRDLDLRGDLPAAALDQLRDPGARLLGRRVGARPQDDLARAGGHGGQAAGDRAAPGDAQTLID
jgi:hypothetical protein